MTAVLTREDILGLLKATPPLAESLHNVDEQVQPNGLDLTAREVAVLSSTGKLGPENKSRVLSSISPLVFDALGGINLSPGCYLITYNEVVNLPTNIMALAMPRSSVLRCGVNVHTAVWDAGYSGRSQSLMIVYNPHGFRLLKDARIVQLVFFRMSHEVPEGYQGVFQRENV